MQKLLIIILIVVSGILWPLHSQESDSTVIANKDIDSLYQKALRSKFYKTELENSKKANQDCDSAYAIQTKQITAHELVVKTFKHDRKQWKEDIKNWIGLLKISKQETSEANNKAKSNFWKGLLYGILIGFASIFI